MKRIIARLYITIITVLILFGLIYLYNQVRVSRNEYIQTSIQVADQTKEIIETNWYKYKNFENQALTDSLKQLMNREVNIHSIIIYSKERGLTKFTSRYNDSDFLMNSLVPDDPAWNMRPEYSFNWWEQYNNNTISTPLKISDRGYSFDLIYNVLSTEKVNKVFGDAFIIVAIFLVLTVFVIIIFTVWKNKYSIKEYDDDFEHTNGMMADDFDQPLSDEDEFESSVNFGDETSDDMDFDDTVLPEGADDTADDLDDFDFDSDNSDALDDLDDFGFDSDSSDELDDLDDFDIAADSSSDDFDMDDIGDETSETADDFDLDFGSEDLDTETTDSVDDFNMDFGSEDLDTEATDSADDFDLDFGSEDLSSETTDTADDFDLDFGSDDLSSETTDSADDFDLDFGSDDLNTETTDSAEDFDLDFDSDDSMDNLDMDSSDEDQVDDFDLDFGSELDTLDDSLDASEDTTDELDLSSELGDEDDFQTDDLDDFDIDIEEDEETSAADEMEDFDLDFDDSEDTTADEPESSITDELDDFDLDIEPESASSDELDDFDLGMEPESSSSDDLDDFDFEVGSDQGEELDDFDAEFGDELTMEDMDLSPEVIEESSNINDLPEMDIEDELLNEDLLDSRVIKDKAEIGPDLSSQLEKAAVEEIELSVTVFHISGDDLASHYDYITENFGETASVYELDNRQIVVSMPGTNSAQAVKTIGTFLEAAKGQNLDMSAGISSTSHRRVGENRLLGEAIKAAERAEETSKPLIAFRPDPEKYKDFIKNS